MKKTIVGGARTMADGARTMADKNTIVNLKRQFGVKVFQHWETEKKRNEIYAEHKEKIDKLEAAIKERQEDYEKHQEGVSEEKQIFGIPLKWLPSTSTKRHGAKIPNVLLHLRSVIVDNNGLRTPGIFRIAPDKIERDDAKAKINCGVAVAEATNKNVHVAASLINVWFQEIPIPILDWIGLEGVLFSCQTVDKVSKAHDKFPAIERSIIIWLWDFLVEVTDHSQYNKMDIKNLAIIFAPCMFNHEKFKDKMQARDFSQHVVKFCTNAMRWRKAESKVEKS